MVREVPSSNLRSASGQIFCFQRSDINAMQENAGELTLVPLKTYWPRLSVSGVLRDLAIVAVEVCVP